MVLPEKVCGREEVRKEAIHQLSSTDGLLTPFKCSNSLYDA